MDRIDRTPLSAASADRLDRLFRRYSKRVLLAAVRDARRPEDAHDIAGQTWLQASRSIATLKSDDDHALAWLLVIARHAAIDFYRPCRASEQPRDWSDAIAASVLPAAPSPEGEVVLLASLPTQERRVLELASQGLSATAIARRVGCGSTRVYRDLNSVRDLAKAG